MQGDFQVRKKIKVDIPISNESVKEFLNGVNAKRSIRGVFNNKISGLTGKRGLTNNTEVVKDEDIMTLTKGQIFGEERFLEIFGRRDYDKKKALRDPQNQLGKLPKDNYNKEITSPYTVKCVSTYGELYKIDNHQFEDIVKNNSITLTAL